MSISLTEILLGNRYTKTYDWNNHKIIMQTLTKAETVEIYKNTSHYSTLAQAESIKVPIIARSIVSIDSCGWELFLEVRDEIKKRPNVEVIRIVEEHLDKISPIVINVLFDFYVDLSEEFQKKVEDLKNSSRDQKPEQSGESVKPSEKPQKN